LGRHLESRGGRHRRHGDSGRRSGHRGSRDAGGRLEAGEQEAAERERRRGRHGGPDGRESEGL
ncbi:hypothetical protein MMC08_007155, partial [Hypocenomyce scalaris]|nr:hypothetical protein [Hypocenomyce scalaris]